ncbi:MAG TPA: hypothetical protein VF221_03515 [Chloroflexota bacterium]
MAVLIVLFIVLALIVFDVVAVFYGFDSRNTRSSGLTSSWRVPHRR